MVAVDRPLDEGGPPDRELRLGFDTSARLLETVVLSSRAATRWLSTPCRPARSTSTSCPGDRHLPSDSLVDSDRDFRPSRDSSDHRRNADERAWLIAPDRRACEERVAVAVAAQSRSSSLRSTGAPGNVSPAQRHGSVTGGGSSSSASIAPRRATDEARERHQDHPRCPRSIHDCRGPRGVGGLCQDDGSPSRPKPIPSTSQDSGGCRSTRTTEFSALCAGQSKRVVNCGFSSHSSRSCGETTCCQTGASRSTQRVDRKSGRSIPVILGQVDDEREYTLLHAHSSRMEGFGDGV